MVYPTDTAYGIGTNAYNSSAVEKVYKLMNRERSKPTHIIVSDWQMVKSLTVVNDKAEILFNKFMPGPLTLVLKKKPDSPTARILSGNLDTLGVRIPKNKITSLLSKYSKIPYITPSANRTGEPTPYSITEVKSGLDITQVDMILDAGILPLIKPSTLIDLTKEPASTIREGAIPESDIFRSLHTSK